MSGYRICGLSVWSELLISGIQQAQVPAGSADVVILRGDVEPPSSGQGADLKWRNDGSGFYYRVPGIARFLVTSGRQVLFQFEESGNDAEAAPFLLSTIMGVLLHQRELLVLHASVVVHQGQAIAICGPSGTGKSTLAAALCQAGCNFLSDDLAVILPDSQGKPVVVPDGRQHRLWADSVEHLSLSRRQGAPVRADCTKFHVDPDCGAPLATAPLKTVVMLRTLAKPHAPGISPLSPADAMALLRSDVFRRGFAERMGRGPRLFAQIAALLGQVQVVRFDRHADFSRLGDDVQLILDRTK